MKKRWFFLLMVLLTASMAINLVLITREQPVVYRQSPNNFKLRIYGGSVYDKEKDERTLITLVLIPYPDGGEKWYAFTYTKDGKFDRLVDPNFICPGIMDSTGQPDFSRIQPDWALNPWKEYQIFTDNQGIRKIFPVR